jgi:hypothetical protein
MRKAYEPARRVPGRAIATAPKFIFGERLRHATPINCASLVSYLTRNNSQPRECRQGCSGLCHAPGQLISCPPAWQVINCGNGAVEQVRIVAPLTRHG